MPALLKHQCLETLEVQDALKSNTELANWSIPVTLTKDVSSEEGPTKFMCCKLQRVQIQTWQKKNICHALNKAVVISS